MSIRGHIVVTLILFVLIGAYGIQALMIPLFPGQELEPFKPRTMPVTLAAVGLLLCAIRIVQLFRLQDAEPVTRLNAFVWRPATLLCATMLAYGFLMGPLGFVVATTLFLAAGFVILGERRKSMLIILPLAFSSIFYLLMTRGLGLYLAPGAWLAA